ncbi:MAG: UDP-N-acetylmuramate--L-alanine ligase [Pseudomonadota bacterium]
MRDPSPFDLGPAHLVGIGGIGMSGIAEVMMTLGYQVQGSDITDSESVARLREKGAAIHIGHAPENVHGAGAVIVSTAITGDNPEVVAARALGIPVVRRANMLAELVRLKWTVCVAGTHGKTTTTSLVAALLDGCGIDPTVINGGIVNAYGSNAKAGAGDWMVVEADESDGTFTKLSPTAAIVTNIDAEHMDHYGSMDALREAFDTFVENTPFYGFAVLCTDHPEVQALAGRVTDRRRITYGFNRQADVRAVNVKTDLSGSHFDVALRRPGSAQPILLEGLSLPMAGDHNVQNALAAITVALELGAEADEIRAALAGFGGVKRRFTPVGEWQPEAGQPPARVIDDYGHHPVEIEAVLKAARAMVGAGQLIAVHEPHRFSRLRDLFGAFAGCFHAADHVFIAPVYSAGEAPLEGIDHDALVASMARSGHRFAEALPSLDGLPQAVAAIAEPGAMIVCLGAGSISVHAASLAGAAAALSPQEKAKD